MSYLEEAKKLFGCNDPNSWPILLSIRLDGLEARLNEYGTVKVELPEDAITTTKPKMTVAERMAKARAGRAKK